MSRRQKKGAYVPQYWSTYVATPPHRVEPSSLLPESLLSAATIVTITAATTTSTPSYGIIYTHKSHGFPISQAPYIGLVLLYQISLRFLLASVCCAYLSHPPPHYCARQTLAPAPTVSSVYLCLLRFPFSPSHAPSFLNITSDFVRHASFSHAIPSITVYYTISAMKNLLFLTPVPLRPSTDNICAHPIARAYECS